MTPPNASQDFWTQDLIFRNSEKEERQYQRLTGSEGDHPVPPFSFSFFFVVVLACLCKCFLQILPCTVIFVSIVVMSEQTKG